MVELVESSSIVEPVVLSVLLPGPLLSSAAALDLDRGGDDTEQQVGVELDEGRAGLELDLDVERAVVLGLDHRPSGASRRSDERQHITGRVDRDRAGLVGLQDGLADVPGTVPVGTDEPGVDVDGAESGTDDERADEPGVDDEVSTEDDVLSSSLVGVVSLNADAATEESSELPCKTCALTTAAADPAASTPLMERMVAIRFFMRSPFGRAVRSCVPSRYESRIQHTSRRYPRNVQFCGDQLQRPPTG